MKEREDIFDQIYGNSEREVSAPRRATPGKSTVTSRMSRPNVNIVFRVADAAAASALAASLGRDNNGVAPSAEGAVARAAQSSSGQALPANLKQRFGASLGTDLSAVRVHTGSASQDAAKAVSAKAYTEGNDIHFAAGRYDPSSATGQHLLAHEVAHTAQQAGGATTRQHKLEVSSPFDAAESEADRAADAMLRGGNASVSQFSVAPVRREFMEFNDNTIAASDEKELASSRMREKQEEALEQYLHPTDREGKRMDQRPATRSEGASTTADVGHANTLIGMIDGATGSLGALQGRESALNKKGYDGGAKARKKFVEYNEAFGCLERNAVVKGKLKSFERSASRQDFQHTLFVPVFTKLGEDFIQLKASVDVIRAEGLQVTGADARADIDTAKGAEPQLGVKIQALKTAIDAMTASAGSATAGLAATAQTASTAFSQLMVQTDAMVLPFPKLEDSAEQAKAAAQISQINADLQSARSTIGSIKQIVSAGLSVATNGLGAAAVPVIDSAVKSIDEKVDSTIKKTGAEGLVAPAKAGVAKAQPSLEGEFAKWAISYNARIAAANGRYAALHESAKKDQVAISVERARSLQDGLRQAIAKFANLMKEVEAKKQAVTDAAKHVQEEAMTQGKNGTDIGATAQAMASVSRFRVQADAAQSLGMQEKQAGDSAQAGLKDAAGDYWVQRRSNEMGGPDRLAGSMPMNGELTHWFDCTVSSDADKRGTYDLSGYKVSRRQVRFVIMEDDKDQRSRVMNDRTTDQLGKISQWKHEAQAFESELAYVLDIGKSGLK